MSFFLTSFPSSHSLVLRQGGWPFMLHKTVSCCAFPTRWDLLAAYLEALLASLWLIYYFFWFKFCCCSPHLLISLIIPSRRPVFHTSSPLPWDSTPSNAWPARLTSCKISFTHRLGISPLFPHLFSRLLHQYHLVLNAIASLFLMQIFPGNFRLHMSYLWSF